MKIKNENNNIKEIYKKLETNPFISYKINCNNKITKDFSLTDKEKECFSIIMNILKKNNLNSTILRVGGGWVRDKLLGKESDDIDIAISDMKGSQLGSLINEELYPGKNKVGIIHKNSEKGKNLETATIKVCQTLIDLVNLRCEEQDKIGTPLSDAEGRDLSINSLFYNINEQKVEDFTGKGIKDLENGIIETPINPEITFRDDPLRILRMLRFAIKYKFRIGNNINNYIFNNTEKIINNFYKNISSERIERELYKIFNLENPSFAIAYLYSFKILDIILLIKNYDPKNNYDNLFLKIANVYILGEYLYEKNIISDIEINPDNFNKTNYSLLLLTLYFRNIKIDENFGINHKILKYTYKTANIHITENLAMCENFDELLNIIFSENYERFKIGKLLRKIKYKNLIQILLASIAYEYIEKIELNSLLIEIDDNRLKNIIEKAKKFLNYIIIEDMLHIDQLKPLFNGKDLLRILNIESGKEIPFFIEFLLDEQIKNPKLNREEAIEKLKNKKEEIGSIISYDDKNKNKKNNKKCKKTK